jgi:peroxiredoxin Q/BCP
MKQHLPADPGVATPPAVELKISDRAPDFTVNSTAGKITLNQLLKQGPVVLAFYPADFTPG